MTMTVEFGTLTPTSTIVVEISISALPAANLSIPACTSFAFISPEPDTEIAVRDCVQSERPREIGPCSGKYYPEATNSVIAIIGGADGPTTITIGVPAQKNIHVACSALHFEPVHEGIEWRIEFGVNEPLKETFQLV